LKCDACGTDNRDAAKFCKGCGGKLAQAWQAPQRDASALPGAAHALPGAPAIVLTGQPLRPEPMPAARPEPEMTFATAPPRRGKGLFVVAGLAVFAVAAAVLVWTQQGRSPVGSEAPAVAASTLPATAAPAMVAMAAAPAPTASASDSATAPVPAPAVAESSPPAAPSPAAKPARKRAAPKPVAPPVVEAPPPAPPPPAPEPVAPPAPQTTCGALNFIAKARCLAAECAKPGVGAHPQCEAVRRQQRIDEEKRNPSGG